MIRTLVVALLLIGSTSAFAKDECLAVKGKAVTGNVTHIGDGDTFDVGAERVRLFGLDSPSNSRPGGKDSTAALSALIAGKAVSCNVVEKTKGGRCMATCTVAGQDVSEQMIKNGKAFVLRGAAHFSPSQAKYDAAELDARTNKRGFWAK